MELTVNSVAHAAMAAKGRYHFNPTAPGTFLKLCGPNYVYVDMITHDFCGSPLTTDIPLSKCRTWDIQIFEIEDHLACLHQHRVAMMPIIAGEAEFLRRTPMVSDCAPDNEVGNIVTGLCPTGTYMLAELAGETISYSSPCLGNLVQVITGPSLADYFCLFYVRHSYRVELISFR